MQSRYTHNINDNNNTITNTDNTTNNNNNNDTHVYLCCFVQANSSYFQVTAINVGRRLGRRLGRRSPLPPAGLGVHAVVQ